MTFASRLVAGTVLVLVFAVGVLVWTAERALREDLEADIARSLERETRLVVEALDPNPAEWNAQVHRLAERNGHQITLLDRQGQVRIDSDIPMDDHTPLPALGDRVDVRAALNGQVASAIERPAGASSKVIHLSMRGGPGVVRLGTRLDQVDATVRRAQQAVVGGAALALLVGIALAVIAGNSVARPLTAITAAANSIAAGAVPRFPRSGIPDIDALVQALRQMHRQLADRFEELREERAESAAMVEAMLEGVIASDGRGRIVTANPAARRLLGYSPDQPLPNLQQLFRAKAARETVDAALHGEPVNERTIDLDGLTVLVNARPLGTGGAVLVLHDVSELRRLEMVRRDFVANVSHELKTPLTSISGYAETLLSDHPDEETQERFLGTILANAQRMQRLVDDLLDLSRIESGRWQPRPERVDVATVAREAWATVAERARRRGVRLSLAVDPAAPAIVADMDAVRQILTNLFDNAIRYTPREGRIVARTRPDGQGVAVEVEDTGSGIGGEHLPRIFERFYRVDSSRSREEGGTGLGLAIVKHLMEGHGGRASVASELGRGTTITCWFPGPPAFAAGPAGPPAPEAIPA